MRLGCKLFGGGGGGGGHIFCEGWQERQQKHLNILPQICMSVLQHNWAIGGMEIVYAFEGACKFIHI